MSQMRERLENELNALIAEQGEDRLTIYHGRSSVDLPHLSSSLRSLITDAAREISAHNREPMKAQLLAQLDELTQVAMRSCGVAIFQTPDSLRIYELPFHVDSAARTAERFHLAPVIAGLSTPGRFYVLALSLHEARVLQVDDNELRWLEFDPDVPRSLEEATPTQYEPQLQYHAGSSADFAAGQDGSAVFHTQPRQERREPEDRKRFLQGVARGVELLGLDGPLVLAGVKDLSDDFRRSSSLDTVSECVEGNVENLSVQKLAAQAREVVVPALRRQEREAKQQADDVAHTDRFSDDVEQVLVAASDGRIDSLFLKRGASVWGQFDVESRSARLGQEVATGPCEDLLERAALDTFRNGGHVFVLPDTELPRPGAASAVLRF